MAAINFDDMGDRDSGGSLAAALNWGGAVLSVLLIAGLTTWGWKLWVRDVTGIPVVRALEGPMRVAPADPGGLATEYQGLAVNTIAESRVEDIAERVVLAPEPLSLDPEEDVPLAQLAPAVAPDALPTVELDEAPSFLAAEDEIADEAVLEAAVAILPEGRTPTATDLAVAAALAGIDLEPTPVSLAVAAGPGVPSATPRPVWRPEGVRVASLAPVVSDVTGEVDAATIPPGTRLVQLGAYGSPEVARAEWANAIARFGDYMVGKERVVQEAETAGRTFWRLRAMGFADLTEARQFCAVLVSDGANCIPVVHSEG